MFIWGHPRAQVNVISPPCIPGILGTRLPAIYNPAFAVKKPVEAEVISMTAELMGYDPGTSGGVFTFGGTGTLLYAIRLGLEKALPGPMQHGLRGDTPVLVCCDQAHYTNKTFRVYPDDVDTFEMPRQEQMDASCSAKLHRFNDFNRLVFQAMHAETLCGDGVVISMTTASLRQITKSP